MTCLLGLLSPTQQLALQQVNSRSHQSMVVIGFHGRLSAADEANKGQTRPGGQKLFCGQRNYESMLRWQIFQCRKIITALFHLFKLKGIVFMSPEGFTLGSHFFSQTPPDANLFCITHQFWPKLETLICRDVGSCQAAVFKAFIGWGHA